jgi:hypothetical protein
MVQVAEHLLRTANPNTIESNEGRLLGEANEDLSWES